MSVLGNVKDNWAKLFKRVEEEDHADKGTIISQMEEEKRNVDVIASLETSQAFGLFLAHIRNMQNQKIQGLRNSDCKQEVFSVLQAEDRALQSVLEIVPKAKQRSAEIRKKLKDMMREDGIV